MLSNVASLPDPVDSVVLRQSGQFVYIAPPVRRLDQWFRTVLHVRVHDRKRGSEIVPLADTLLARVTRHGQPTLRCPAGLQTLIKELLERHGLRVTVLGEPASLSAPAGEGLAAFKRVDHALLSFVRHHDRGLIWYERQGKVGVYRLVAQIALAWPDERIAVVVTRIEDARRLARRLQMFLPRVGLVTGRDCKHQPHRRVVVTTPDYLRRGDVAAEKRRICIALNPTELFRQAPGNGDDVFKSLWTARLYGLAATDEQFPPRLRDLMVAYFGPQEVLIPRHGHRQVDVRVVFSPIRGGPPLPTTRDQALVKRLGVLEHRLRNRRICNLAAALASNDADWLKADYPEVAACLGGKVGRVGILVDHVPHGLALAHSLKSILVVGPSFHAEGLAADDLVRIKVGRQVSSRPTNPVVVTGCGMKYAGRFDVLIRADGGVDLPNIPLVMLSAPDDERREMLLIDFRDEQHPLLRRWSRMRRTSYDEAGWTVAGLERSALDRFLATRPEVV